MIQLSVWSRYLQLGHGHRRSAAVQSVWLGLTVCFKHSLVLPISISQLSSQVRKSRSTRHSVHSLAYKYKTVKAPPPYIQYTTSAVNGTIISIGHIVTSRPAIKTLPAALRAPGHAQLGNLLVAPHYLTATNTTVLYIPKLSPIR